MFRGTSLIGFGSRCHGEREKLALNVPDRIEPEAWDAPELTADVNPALLSLWE